MRRRMDYLPLAAILLLAAGLRFWSLDFGLPDVRVRPDEQQVVGAALGFFRGDFHPGFFHYPSLYLYLLFAVFRLFAWGGILLGQYDSTDGFLAAMAQDPAPLYLLDRGLSATLGVVTVGLVYRLGERLFDRRVGLLAALFLAVTYLHVRESHFGVTDVAATCLLTAAALAVVRAYRQGRPRDFVLAGVWAGLATATKYIGILMVAPVVLAVVFRVREEHEPGQRLRRLTVSLVTDRRPWIFLLYLLLAFCLTTPYALIDFQRFQQDVAFEARHLEEGHMGLAVPAWRAHLLRTLPHGVGLPLLALAMAGLVLGFRRSDRDRRQALAVLYLLPLLYLLVALRGQTAFVRYMVPLAPFIALAAAQFFALWPAFRSRIHPRAIAALLAIAAVLPPLWNSIRCDQLLGRADSRVLARQWILKNIPPGTSLAQTGREIPTVQLPPLYDEWRIDIRSGLFEGKLRRQLPQYLVVEDSALEWYNRPIRRISQLPERFYGPVWEVRAADLTPEVVARNVYDQQDLFYLPFGGFHGVERPGPNITIYHLGYHSPQKR